MSEGTLEDANKFLIYQPEDGRTRISVRLEGETVWLTQLAMAELFETTKQNISLHINNIFDEGELSREATVKKYLTVQKEGNREVKRELEYYNLEAIIAVGFRVRSQRGTQFRRWATERLREYPVEGFVMADERHQPMTMRDWREKLDAFLQFNQREVLRDAGTVSSEVAKALAAAEYEKFRVARLAQEAQQPDEFDRMAKQLMAGNEGQA